MILAIDVQYVETTAYVAGVTFSEWNSPVPDGEYVTRVDDVEEYVPGSFYKRELPCILSLLNKFQLIPKVIVIDGYVYLDGKEKPGLGKYLYDSLDQQVTIIGVAKKSFAGIAQEHEIFRGKSKKALYVTSSDQLENAKGYVQKMHGDNRIPVLLKRADQLCREHAKERCEI